MPVQQVLLYSIGISTISFVSGSIPLIKTWSNNLISLFVSFGAGVILAVAFLHMIPEAIEISGSSVGLFLLIGFSLIFILEKFIMMHPCDEHHCDFHYVGIAALVGFSLHSILMGVSLGSSMRSGTLGFMVFLAIIIHKIPESFSLTTLLAAGNKYSKKQIYLIIFIFSLLVPLGMIVTLNVMTVAISPRVVGYIISIAAGTFIEIAACDILPELHRSGEWRYKNLGSFVFGLLSIGLLEFIH